jgi:hypothetical protein
MFDRVSGGIIGDDNESPLHSANSNGIPPSSVPDLRNWSDAVALHWKNETSKPENLNWIIRAHVVNDETRNIVVEALRKKKLPNIPSFPGKYTFSMDTDEGLAMLGTPNGAAGGWMLAEHRAIFGIKTIESVTVWARFEWEYNNPDLNDLWLHLYFKVRPHVPT